MKQQLILSHIAYPVTSLGPGNRIALWVAGCPMRCKECITPQLQDKKNGKLIDRQKLLQRIFNLDKQILDKIDGMTFSGGEPFAQAEQLAFFWQEIKTRYPHWNLLIFSGYQYHQLAAKKESQRLLSLCDILIDGPYVAISHQQKKASQHPLIASNNQQIHLLSNRAKALHLDADLYHYDEANIGLGKEQHWLIGIIDKPQRIHYHQLLNS